MRVKDSGMTERTLPPKKSRTGFESEEQEVNGDKEEESDDEYVNVFETTVVQGKRRHFENKANKELDDWLDSHLEVKEGFKTNATGLYDAYIALCMEKNITNALDLHAFIKFVQTKFPVGYATKEDSSLKSQLKVAKKEKKEKKPSAPQITKTIIEEAFAEMESPREGVMFNTLKKHMDPKHPALRLDLKPNRLMSALNTGLRNGYVELLKGIGKAGRYRWYDADADKREEQEDQERRQKRREEMKAAKDGAEKDEKSDDKKEGESSADGETKEGEEEGKEPKKKLRKRKATPSTDKKKSKAKKKKNAKKPSRSFIVHSDPQRIEECFPLAMTFMAEPKKASFQAIEKYIDKYYNVEVKTEKLLKTLETMEEKGYLERASGGGRGVYQLTLDEFDPTDDDDLIGKIVNAIMANVFPKECSVRCIKSYVDEFYPTFEVNEKPHKFKKALERAVSKNIIRQVSGVGLTGSYQLTENFIPTPLILASKDTAEDYDSDDEDDVSSDEGVISDAKEVDVSFFMDAYKPRPTKRRGKARAVQKSGFNPNQAYLDAQLRQEAARRVNKVEYMKKKRTEHKKQHKKSLIRTPKKRRYEESSDEEDKQSSEEEEQASDSASNDEDSTYGSESGEKYRPRASSSRGGKPSKRPAPKAKAKMATPKKAANKVSTKAEKTTPPKKASHKKAAKKPVTKGKTAPAAKGKKSARSKRRR